MASGRFHDDEPFGADPGQPRPPHDVPDASISFALALIGLPCLFVAVVLVLAVAR